MSVKTPVEIVKNLSEQTITVSKLFNAPLQRVWDAYTNAEKLDQWWAPLPYKNETKTMDFREGGKWHYSMISPEGEKHWCLAFYDVINSLQNFEVRDSFCNEEGEPNNSVPSMKWNNNFKSETDVTTLLTVTIKFATVQDLETIVSMGFEVGFTMGLNQLEELLNKSSE